MSVENKPENFIEQIISEDLSAGFSSANLKFRFPPEPNGYLHIGHAKAISLNFGLGEKYNAPVNLRFDDTNPAKEELEYVVAIKEDVSWLGYKWAEETYSSDNFQKLYEWAVFLIDQGLAYVDSQTSEEMAIQKGSPTKPGENSPFRSRPVSESLALFEQMKNGDHPENKHVLRAKIDMGHSNMLMRDPIIYRVLKKTHHRTSDDWNIYPMYDWAHGQCDYIEQVSHSLCSLEFKPHRELYDWFLNALSKTENNLETQPKQREFARLNLSYTIMSKRKLSVLVEKNIVSGWDDPRMPTISGLRRRGYTPTSIRSFIEKVGVAKRENLIDVSLLEFCIREDLNKTANRKMVVMDPIKLTISNYPEGKTELLTTENNPEDEGSGTRELPFNKHLFIEREDFKEEANRKFFRLTTGKEVRLKSAYIIVGRGVIKDNNGKITEILCEYDPKSKSGSGSEESLRKVKGTLHWVTQNESAQITVNSYDRLFKEELPGNNTNQDFLADINPDSFKVNTAYAEPSILESTMGQNLQFQRKGYFVMDKNSKADNPVFNKTVGLRDSWKKK
ncbi:MAG: glutamine--tRNA ligase/YqeY domain fusion protein [Flavobacteriaceae bacterium]|nr:glutamine--tRNA ligase/YqeY domain fusion protein [Flavobacteriaceae bacterium]